MSVSSREVRIRLHGGDGWLGGSGLLEERIIVVMREHEAGAKTADLARKHGTL